MICCCLLLNCTALLLLFHFHLILYLLNSIWACFDLYRNIIFCMCFNTLWIALETCLYLPFHFILRDTYCSFLFYIFSGLASSPLQAVCEVRAKGVFPTLRVIDVCSGGSVGRLSKGHLWKLFSLDRLNELMLSNPCPAELTHRTPIRHRWGKALWLSM